MTGYIFKDHHGENIIKAKKPRDTTVIKYLHWLCHIYKKYTRCKKRK